MSFPFSEITLHAICCQGENAATLECNHHQMRGRARAVAIRFKVKEVAGRQGFSQHRLAKESGVDLRTLRRIFRYPTEIVVSSETLDRLATTLGVDVAELLESFYPEKQPPQAQEKGQEN